MRIKIDYGIDLGTTNSAIARMENGKPIIRKSDTLKDTTPSSVSITKKKDFLVGDTAVNVAINDNKRALKNWEKGQINTYFEFKRMMGTTHTYDSSNLNTSLSSDELSSEVLKKLKSYILDENINSVVITVPAKFLNPQKDATIKAAKLAGFKHIELLQEPVAAATAYGLTAAKKDGYWVVFDFGGGTFDAALVKAEQGILSVKDTAGDNWLGGKKLDYAIVDEIIIPYLKNNYSMDFVLNDEIKLKLLRDVVKRKAEEAKNALSFKDSFSIYTEDINGLNFQDEKGVLVELDIQVTQKDMERVLAPIFQEAIDITKELLKHNNLKGSDVDALILVGGPTYSPILRRMLKEQITEKVDTSIDPMTAVAVGAALFASTISVSEEVKEDTRDKTKLQLEINYAATSVEFDEMINIAVLKDKTEGKLPEKIFAEISRGDGAWSSGKKQIGEKKSIVDVLLVEGSNQFTVSVYDEQGNRIDCQPNQFSVLQGIGGLDSMTVLPYNIGIVKYFETEEKDLFAFVKGLEKNQKVPATGVRNDLKTRRQIRPGVANDIIKIPIYQGEHKAEGSNPFLNHWVYDVIITGETIPKLLPEGSDVEITIKVDRSEKMQFTAYFPAIEHYEELEVDIKKPEPPATSFIQNEIDQAKRTARKVNDGKAVEKLEKLEKDLGNSGGNADGKLQVLDGLRKELLTLEEKEKTTVWPEVEKQLKNSFYELEDLLNKIRKNGDDENLKMETINAHLDEYRTKIDQTIKDKNVKEAKDLIKEIEQLDFELRNIVTGNGMDIEYLNLLDETFNSYHWKDSTRARQLVNQGLQMVESGNTSSVRTILIQLINLMLDGEKPKETLK